MVDVPDKNLKCISRGCFPNKACESENEGEKFVLECDGKTYQTDLHCCSGGTCNAAPPAATHGADVMTSLLLAMMTSALLTAYRMMMTTTV